MGNFTVCLLYMLLEEDVNVSLTIVREVITHNGQIPLHVWTVVAIIMCLQ